MPKVDLADPLNVRLESRTPPTRVLLLGSNGYPLRHKPSFNEFVGLRYEEPLPGCQGFIYAVVDPSWGRIYLQCASCKTIFLPSSYTPCLDAIAPDKLGEMFGAQDW